jgi:hypothetical protein
MQDAIGTGCSRVIVAAVLGVAGCGEPPPGPAAVDARGDDPPPGAPDAGVDAAEACVTVLGEAVISHACLHATVGPFASVTAQADAEPVSTHVNAPHTLYTIVLPAAGGGHHAGAVRYRPVHGGAHAFLLHPEVALEVRDPQGGLIDPPHVQPVTSCPGLSHVVVVELVGGGQHELRFGPTSHASVALVVEHLETFGEETWDCVPAPA